MKILIIFTLLNWSISNDSRMQKEKLTGRSLEKKRIKEERKDEKKETMDNGAKWRRLIFWSFVSIKRPPLVWKNMIDYSATLISRSAGSLRRAAAALTDGRTAGRTHRALINLTHTLTHTHTRTRWAVAGQKSTLGPKSKAQAQAKTTTTTTATTTTATATTTTTTATTTTATTTTRSPRGAVKRKRHRKRRRFYFGPDAVSIDDRVSFLFSSLNSIEWYRFLLYSDSIFFWNTSAWLYRVLNGSRFMEFYLV